MRERRVYDVVPKWQAEQDTEGKYIKTRWVEIMKNDEVRSRFVACEIAAGDPREDLFAGTPPLHAARMLLSMCATLRKTPWKLLVLCSVSHPKTTALCRIRDPAAQNQTGNIKKTKKHIELYVFLISPGGCSLIVCFSYVFPDCLCVCLLVCWFVGLFPNMV